MWLLKKGQVHFVYFESLRGSYNIRNNGLHSHKSVLRPRQRMSQAQIWDVMWKNLEVLQRILKQLNTPPNNNKNKNKNRFIIFQFYNTSA